MLGILRKRDEGAELAPQPSLRRVDALVAQVREAGLDATLTVEGKPADLPQGLDMSAYRIVQEALTNAMRYAPGSNVGVTVAYGRDLRLEIRDDGARTLNGHATPGSGHGIVGMRERAALFGGELEAGPEGKRLRRPCEAAAMRVVVADDQALVRAGLKMVLEAEDDIEVVGEAADGEEVLEVARRTQPDVVLMDIRMPVLDGLEASRRLLARDDPPKVLVLTTFDEEEYLYEALRAGTSGFLLKVSPPEQLIGAVRTVAAGNALIDPTVTRRVIEAFGRRAATRPAPRELEELTARELEVLKLLARGLSNQEIAAELIVGDATVKTHVARVLMKLGLRDRVQAVVFAYEHGIVEPGAGP